MKPLRGMLLLTLLSFVCGTAMGSEEDIRPWTSVDIKTDGTPESGTIRVVAEVSGDAYTSFRMHAFGREEALGKADLEILKGYPLSSIEITSEAGYASIGGYTVHVRLKRTSYDASKKLRTEVMVASLQKTGGIKLMKMPERNPN